MARSQRSDVNLRSTPRGMLDAELSIQLLGGFKVVVAGRELDESTWRLRKGGHLIKLLALAQNHRLHREQVIEWLWPDLPPQAAANNLYHALYVVRRMLSSHPEHRERYIRSQEGALHLGDEVTTWIDVDVFERAAARARGAPSGHEDPGDYHEAVARYSGDLLPQDRYEPWASGPRENLRRSHLKLLREAAQLHRNRSEFDLAIELLQRLVDLDPVDEAAHADLMQLYSTVGLRHQALQQYQLLRTALRRELDAAPDRGSSELYRAILAGEVPVRDRVPPGRGPPATEAQADPSSPQHNLPAEITSFVGREQELEEIQELLNNARLLTLTGPGGIGKTRLALAVARRTIGAFPDGVYFVSLATIRDPELVVPAIAQTLDVRETGDETLLDSLKDAVVEQRLLLILDNLEHLTPAGSLLIELLEHCPSLKVLATSRIRLRLGGERDYPILPLSLPDPELESAGGDPTWFTAVDLFIQRSREVRPDFQVIGDNAQTIARICRRLEGVPLAIELAAARSAVLAPDALLDRLDKPLALLTGGPRDLPARQQTVRDTIAWSYELLTPQQQWLFHRLSVFVGGWTLKAAEAVVQGAEAAGAPAFEPVVLDSMTALVDHSLVRTEEIASNFRFSMLETIHEFALEQLTSEGEVEQLRQRHAAFFLDLAEQADPALLGPDEGAWLDALEWELGNLRAALDWTARNDPTIGLRLAAALWQFWDMRGRLAEGRRWLELMLDQYRERKSEKQTDSLLSSPQSSASDQARALFVLGYLATRQGDRVSAQGPLEEALSIFHRIGHKPGEARTLAMLGALASFEGDFDRSTLLLEQALAAFRETGDKLGVARTLLDLGDQVRVEGDYSRARMLLSESLDLFRTLEFPRGAGWALTNLGNTARAEGDIDRARTLQEESRLIFQELRDKRGLARPVLYLANLARMRGDDGTASRLLHESLEMLREIRDQWRLPVWLYSVALFAGQQERFASSVRLIAAASSSHERFETLLDPAERAEGDAMLAEAREVLGDEEFTMAWSEGEALAQHPYAGTPGAGYPAIDAALDELRRS